MHAVNTGQRTNRSHQHFLFTNLRKKSIRPLSCKFMNEIAVGDFFISHGYLPRLRSDKINAQSIICINLLWNRTALLQPGAAMLSVYLLHVLLIHLLVLKLPYIFLLVYLCKFWRYENIIEFTLFHKKDIIIVDHPFKKIGLYRLIDLFFCLSSTLSKTHF